MAKKKGKELVPELIELGLLTNIDLGALEMCCEAYSMSIEANKAIYNYVDEDGNKHKRFRIN